MEKELICVNCPVGCRLTVTVENDTVTNVTGNNCPRGKAYAESECIRPERILTTTVRITGGLHRVLPVISERGSRSIRSWMQWMPCAAYRSRHRSASGM